MLQRLKARGLRICVWINPYIAQRSPLFAQGMAKGYLLRRPSGDVWRWDRWQPGMAVADFTNPDARDWYASKLAALLDAGVVCFKSDFGERTPSDVTYFDGSDPERMHNYHTCLYNKTVFELLRQHRGEGGAIVFARSATTGSQQFPVHWSGDSECTFAGMGETLRGGLSLGMPGFDAAGEVAYYVPEGTWTHLLTSAEVTGPRWHAERHGFMSVPVLARPGAVIPVGAVADRPDYNYADGVTLQVYRLPEGAARTVTVPVADPRRQPAALTVSRDRDMIRASVGGPARPLAVAAGRGARGRPVTGGTAAAHEQGTLIWADGAPRSRSRSVAGQHSPDPGHQLIGVERLGEVIVGAGLEAARDVRVLHAGTHQQDRQLLGGRPSAQPLGDLVAVEPWHHHVEHRHVQRLRGGEPERLLAVTRLDHAEAGPAQPVGDQLTDVLLIVGDQDGLRHSVASARAVTGSSTTNRVPPASASATRIVPPCPSAMALLIASPSPVPAVPAAVDAR